MTTRVTPEPDDSLDVLIIGAGMAGLTAARALVEAGCRVRVVDKGKAPGGRLASRRMGGATFDHGAQFFVASDPRFQALICDGQAAGVIKEWNCAAGEEGDGRARWRGHPCMRALAVHLACGLDVILDVTITAVRVRDGYCEVEGVQGELHRARAVILTAPVPQSLVMLKAGGVTVPEGMKLPLESVDYERCLAVLVTLDRPSRLPATGFVPPSGGPIAWMAATQSKGVSAEPGVIIHATHAFSVDYWDRDRADVGRMLVQAASQWMGAGVTDVQVHGWRYARPLRTEDRPCAILSASPLLVLAGDALGGPHLEGAARSGWAAAAAVRQSLT